MEANKMRQLRLAEREPLWAQKPLSSGKLPPGKVFLYCLQFSSVQSLSHV